MLQHSISNWLIVTKGELSTYAWKGHVNTLWKVKNNMPLKHIDIVLSSIFGKCFWQSSITFPTQINWVLGLGKPPVWQNTPKSICLNKPRHCAHYNCQRYWDHGSLWMFWTLAHWLSCPSYWASSKWLPVGPDHSVISLNSTGHPDCSRYNWNSTGTGTYSTTQTLLFPW